MDSSAPEVWPALIPTGAKLITETHVWVGLAAKKGRKATKKRVSVIIKRSVITEQTEGGRWRFRTADLCRVKAALSH